MLLGEAVVDAQPCEQSVSCHGWQSLVVNVVSVGSISTTCGFLVIALSTVLSPLARFQEQTPSVIGPAEV
jgi:hypothetical protein